MTVAAAIVLSLLEDVDDDQVDPKAEVERLFDWQAKLAEMGFKPTRTADAYMGMRQEFKNGQYMLIVLGPRKDVTADLEVQYYTRDQDGQKWICDTTQTVPIGALPVLLKDFLRWLA